MIPSKVEVKRFSRSFPAFKLISARLISFEKFRRSKESFSSCYVPSLTSCKLCWLVEISFDIPWLGLPTLFFLEPFLLAWVFDGAVGLNVV